MKEYIENNHYKQSKKEKIQMIYNDKQSDNNLNKTKRIRNNNYILLFMLFISINSILLFFFIIIMKITFIHSQKNKKYQNRKLQQADKIIIKISGKGTQTVLCYNFKSPPSEVYLNNNLVDLNSGYTINNIIDEENTVILKWNYRIETFDFIFAFLWNIIEVDLTNFDTSKITSMDHMFSDCYNLKSVKLDNIDTSSTISMYAMFIRCYSLTSLNLSSFHTSSLKIISYMFNKCYSLTSLDLSNFDTSSVDEFNNLFESCGSLVYLNISNFNTLKATSMVNTFYNCSSLKSLDLSSFVTSSVTSMENMFSYCSSLTSLDLSNFQTSSVSSFKNMFYECNNVISINIPNFNLLNCEYMSNMFGNCNNLQFINMSNVVEGNRLNSGNMIDMFVGVPENLVLCTNNENNIQKIESELQKKKCPINDCSNNWKKHQNIFISESNTCADECSGGMHEYKKKCYWNCPEYTHLSDDNKYCLNDCSEDLPFEKNEECVEKCNIQDFLNNICIINNKNIDTKEYIVYEIRKEIIDGSINSLLANLLDGDKNDLIVKDINEIYQITTVYNQKNNEYNNGEITINIGECEDILKSHYHINEDETLIIFKMDYFIDDFLIPITEYEIYHPITKEKLDLNVCNSVPINIYIPVGIDETNINKYNPNSEYYKEVICQNDLECEKDNILSERINEFNDNFLSLCEKNCLYKEYFSETKKVLCECNIKNEFMKLSEILNMKNELLYQITQSSKESVAIEKESESQSDSESDTDSESQSDSESDTKSDTDFESESDSYLNEELITFSNLMNKNYIPDNTKETINTVLDLFVEALKNKTINSSKDEIITGENIIFQMTTTKRQNDYINNNKLSNISSIDLKECEEKLKSHYQIDDSDSLVILKIDIKNNITPSTQIEYEVYNPKTLEKLELSVCEGIQIDIYPPVDLNQNMYNLVKNLKEQGYDLFNSSDNFYNDLCSPYSSIDNTDVLLKDRKYDFYNSNITLCEDTCEYKEFDINSLKAKCQCKLKTEIKSDEVKFSPNKIIENFYKIDEFSNIKVAACYNLVFNLIRLKKNYGSYIIISVSFIFIITMIINFITINQKIKSIFKNISSKYRTTIDVINKIKGKNSSNKSKVKINNNIKINNNKKINNNIKVDNNNKFLKSKLKSSKKNVNNPKKKKNFNILKISNRNNKRNKTGRGDNSASNAKMSTYKEKLIYIDNSKHKNNTINNIVINKFYNTSKKNKYMKKEEVIGYNIIKDIITYIPKAKRRQFFCEGELNELSYEYSLVIDFRSFFQLYYSLLKQNHILFNTFVVHNDYNIFLLKLSLFVLNFALFCFVNTLFFDDDLIHKIYEEKGKYNFNYQIPKILYSIVITQILSFLLEHLSLLQDNFLSIKDNGPNFIKMNIKKATKIIKIKALLFYIIGILLLIFFWYFLSAFNALYSNIQIQLIKDILISYCTSFLYPFVLILFPTGLRLISLRYKKKCLFTFNKIIVNKIISICE